MAVGTSVYEAIVFRTVDGQVAQSYETVDLLDLGAVKFDKIIIRGDVNLGNGKNNPLPDFSNVEINGEFDCSTFAISSDSILPKGITGLVCYYSINNLDNLSEILPDSVKKVYVRNAIINAVQKDDGSLQSAKAFISKFPDVHVVGKTGNLSLVDAVLKKLDKENVGRKVAPAKSSVVDEKPGKDTSIKREGYLTIAEAADKLKELEAFKGISVKELKKRIKTFLYNDSDNSLWGNIQNYVRKESINELADVLLIENTDETVKEETAQDNVVESKEIVEEVDTKKADAVVELKPVVIKKFFDKRVWNIVCKTVKNNKDQLIRFLNNINDVNLNPIQKDSRISSDRVACIKNNSLKLVPNLELKSGSYIAQGFGRSNNRPRVVWCVLPSGELVASAFFANHGDGKNKCIYNSTLLSNVLRDRTQKAFNESKQDYLDVEDLLKNLTNTNTHDDTKMDDAGTEKKSDEDIVQSYGAVSEVQPEKKQAETVVKSVAKESPGMGKAVEKSTEPAVPAVADVAAPTVATDEVQKAAPSTDKVEFVSIKEPVKVKRPRIRVVTETVKVSGNKPKLPDNNSDILYSCSYKFEEVFNILDKSITDIKQRLLAETNTEESLKLANELSDRLKDKQMLEQNLDVAKRAFEVFKLCINQMNTKHR